MKIKPESEMSCHITLMECMLDIFTAVETGNSLELE